MDDLSGRKYGRWVVIRYSHSDKNYNSIWECICDCGKDKLVSAQSLKAGKSLSCGCLNIEMLKLNKRHGATSGSTTTSEYMAWSAMKARCLNDKCDLYKNYGGRGICICERWLHNIDGFSNFLKDMGDKPNPKFSLDRIDNDGNYEPSNCRWALPKIQNRNTRRNRWLSFDGQKKVLQDWADDWGVAYQQIQGAISNGYSNDEIYKRFSLKEKIRHNRIFDGRSDSKHILVFEKGIMVREYNSISQAVRGEKSAKNTILNHIRGFKFIRNKKTKQKKWVPVDFSVCRKVFKAKI